MKKQKLMKDILQGLLMAAAVAAVLPLPELAFAQSDLGATTSRLTSQELNHVPDVISAVFYIGGAALMGAGGLKCKMHIDAPAQNKLGECVGRLGVGAFLLALPYVSTVVINTFGWGQSAAAYQGFNPVT